MDCADGKDGILKCKLQQEYTKRFKNAEFSLFRRIQEQPTIHVTFTAMRCQNDIDHGLDDG